MGYLQDLYGNMDNPLDPWAKYGLSSPTPRQQASPWYFRALGQVGRALEPVALLGALLRSGIEDIAAPGQGKFLATLRNAPAYAPFGAQPQQISTGETFLGSLGVQAPARWQSILAEFAVDPLIFGAALSGASKAAKLAGMGSEAASLSKAAATMNYYTSAQPLVAGFRAGVKAVGAEPYLEAVMSKAFQLLDTPIPGIPARGSFALRRVSESTDPLMADIANRNKFATLGELIFPFGNVPGAKSRLQGGTAVPEELVGGPGVGVGTYRLAEGARVQHGELAARTHIRSEALSDQLADIAFGAKGNALDRLRNMGREVDRNSFKLQFKQIVGSWVDDFGGGSDDLFAVKARLNPEQFIARAPGASADPQNLERLMVRSSQTAKTYMQKLTELGTVYGVPGYKMREVGSQLAAEGFAAASYYGAELSGLSKLQRAVDGVATDLGVGGHEIWKNLRLDAANYVEGPTLPGYKVQTLTNAVIDKARDIGVGNFTTVDFFNYLKGLDQGYLRKLYAGVSDPAAMAARLETGHIGAFKQLDPSKFSQSFNSFGAGATEAIARYAASRPNGVVTAQDVLSVLHKNGATATMDDVASRIRHADPSNNLFADIYEKLISSGEQLKRGGTPLQFGLNKAAFQQRVLDEVGSVAHLEMADLDSRIAALAFESGRGVKSQVVLEGMNDLLNKNGMVFDNLQAARQAHPDLRFVQPPTTGSWGGLSGKWIPDWASRQITQTLKLPGSQQFMAFQRMTGAVRSGFLAGLGTTVRNIVGNVMLLDQAGVDMADLLPHLRDGWKEIKFYQQNGYTNKLAGAERVLNLFSDGTLSASAMSIPEETLLQAVGARAGGGFIDTLAEAVASKNPTRVVQAIANVDNLVKLNQTAPFGFLGWFQQVEDSFRAGLFLQTKKALLTQGIQPQEAIEQAAYFANNALYDYSRTGQLVESMRNSGLALFPAFSYFTVGRTAKLMYENPGRLALQEKTINAATDAMVGDDEQDRLDRIINDTYIANQRPLPIPAEMFGGEKGKYYLLPLSSFMPQGAVNSGTLVDTFFSGPLTGGFWKPLVEIGMAVATGSGEAPISARYGERVYDPTGSGVERAIDATQFLARAYDPSNVGFALGAAKALPLMVDQEQAAYAARALDKWLNVGAAQWVAKGFGFNTREYDTSQGISQNNRARQITAQFQQQERELGSQKRYAIATGNLALMQQIQQKELELQRKKAEAMAVVFGR